MTFSVILPCYNEAQNIEAAVRDVYTWMNDASLRGEIIVVDDGSTDASLSILTVLQKECSMLRIIQHETNGGYGVAVRTGCDAAVSDVIGFMDSDGQFHAKDFDLLLAHIDEVPFATGRRRKRADSLLRNMFGKVLGAMNVLALGLWVRDVNCGLKIFRREIWPEIRPEYGVEKLFNTEMFLRLKQKGIAWKQVDVPHYPRRAGTPTGGSVRVIVRMFHELSQLRKAQHHMQDS